MSVNLTHPQTVRYLKEFIDEGLLISSKSKPFRSYEITPKGQRNLKVFEEIEDDLRPVIIAEVDNSQYLGPVTSASAPLIKLLLSIETWAEPLPYSASKSECFPRCRPKS